MSKNVRPLLDLGSLPFHIRVMDAPENGRFPTVLPFKLGVLEGPELVVQCPNAEVSEQLAQVYREGTIIGTPMEPGGFGRAYAEDFLAFIKRVFARDALVGGRVLEVGCGYGYLLSRIAETGADVTGVEPGAHAAEGMKLLGDRIIRDVFPTHALGATDRFDAVVSFAVLEHIEDPVSFVRAMARQANPGGRLVIAVPDCTDHIQHGDVGMLLHEHWSYFTRESLASVLEAAGVRPLSIERSGYGGLLYASAAIDAPGPRMQAGSSETSLLADRIRDNVDAARALLKNAESRSRSVGVFCAARAFNLLQLAAPSRVPRFFDDDPRLHGRYYPPLGSPVEARESLLERPVDELIVYSRSFGHRLRSDLERAPSLSNTRMTLPDEIAKAAEMLAGGL